MLTLRGAKVLGAVEGFFASPQKVAEDIPVVGTLVLDEGFPILQAAAEALVSARPLPVMVLIVTCPSELAAGCHRAVPTGAARSFFPTSPPGLVDLLLSTLLGVVRLSFSTRLLGEVKMFVATSFIREAEMLPIIPCRVVGVVSSAVLPEGLVFSMVATLTLSLPVVPGVSPRLLVTVTGAEAA